MYNDSQSWLAFPTHYNKCSLYYAIRVLKIATDRDLLHTISLYLLSSQNIVVYIMTCLQQYTLQSTVSLHNCHSSYARMQS